MALVTYAEKKKYFFTYQYGVIKRHLCNLEKIKYMYFIFYFFNNYDN